MLLRTDYLLLTPVGDYGHGPRSMAMMPKPVAPNNPPGRKGSERKRIDSARSWSPRAAVESACAARSVALILGAGDGAASLVPFGGEGGVAFGALNPGTVLGMGEPTMLAVAFAVQALRDLGERFL